MTQTRPNDGAAPLRRADCPVQVLGTDGRRFVFRAADGRIKRLSVRQLENGPAAASALFPGAWGWVRCWYPCPDPMAPRGPTDPDWNHWALFEALVTMADAAGPAPKEPPGGRIRATAYADGSNV